MPRLFIHAINVHHGGGAVLLCDLLRAIPPNVETVVHVDARMNVPSDLPDNVHVKRVEPTLPGRFAAERRLVEMVEPDDRVLCFGNLPPMFRLRGEAVVFIQNRYLVDPSAPLCALPLKPRIRLWLERALLRGRRFNASRYIVQTASMQRLTAQQLGMPVSCAPFVPADVLRQADGRAEQRFDFLYVASGEVHKNHAALIDAWGLLADDGYFPSLVLTLSPDAAPELCRRVAQEVASRGLRIQNLGVMAHDQLLAVYRESGALIYPSGFESFGLPLIEARHAGLPVLAPELDYVRDVIDPEQTFDPCSPMSIARAVRRHLGGRTELLEPRGVEVFLGHVLSRDAP
jgi:glycosyltransferase involved in cell wall biosynthesis